MIMTRVRVSNKSNITRVTIKSDSVLRPIDLSLCGADHVRGRVEFQECCGNLVAELEARAKFPGRQLATLTFNYK